jgi:type III pantothenate kinase
MKLLLDLGNTRLKWALLAPNGEWTSQDALDWDAIASGALLPLWQSLPLPLHVFGASVVDDARERQIEALVDQLFQRQPIWLRTPAAACGVRNAYAEPHRLGVDRFLAMIAAMHEGKAPCILASVGTALTLDALAGDGRHLGGWIAPGPPLMQRALLDNTTRVQLDHAGHVVDAADNTMDAVASGCWHAAAALIERFHARMRTRFEQSPTLRLSGGDAATVLPLLSLPAELVHDPVLRGLAVWANAQRDASASV